MKESAFARFRWKAGNALALTWAAVKWLAIAALVVACAIWVLGGTGGMGPF